MHIRTLSYSDLAYTFKRTVGKPKFSDDIKNIIESFKRVGYNMDVLRQSAYLVVNPVTVDSFVFLFNCTTVGQASDLMKTLT